MLIYRPYETSGDPGDTVALPNLALINFLDPPNTVYSGLRFGSDGNIYKRQQLGGYSNVGAWLLNGTASDFYISRTIDSGTLDTDAGAGPLQLNANRDYDINGKVQETATVTFEISNDMSGTPILKMQTYIFTIETTA